MSTSPVLSSEHADARPTHWEEVSSSLFRMMRALVAPDLPGGDCSQSCARKYDEVSNYEITRKEEEKEVIFSSYIWCMIKLIA